MLPYQIAKWGFRLLSLFVWDKKLLIDVSEWLFRFDLGQHTNLIYKLADISVVVSVGVFNEGMWWWIKFWVLAFGWNLFRDQIARDFQLDKDKLRGSNGEICWREGLFANWWQMSIWKYHCEERMGANATS